jgi:GT2 family glycosyltransferase
MKIAILLPVFNKLSYTRTCLDAMYTELSKGNLMDSYSCILVDDGSTDGTEEFIRQHFPFVHILRGDGNLWWSGGINKGATYAISALKADYVLLWNNDITTHGNYFGNILKILETTDRNTIIGSKIYADYNKRIVWSMGGTLNPYIGRIRMIGYNKIDGPEYEKMIEAEWIPGMGTIVPVEIIKNIGFWDDANFPQYHGDSEFTYRAKCNGYRNIVSPDLVLSNDTRNTGLSHGGSYKKLLKMFRDKRSLYNYQVNMAFFKKYGKGPFRYFHLFKSYAILILSFLKWKFSTLFKTNR